MENNTYQDFEKLKANEYTIWYANNIESAQKKNEYRNNKNNNNMCNEINIFARAINTRIVLCVVPMDTKKLAVIFSTFIPCGTIHQTLEVYKTEFFR